MTTSKEKKPNQGQLRIVRKYDAGNSNDLDERLKVVFGPWIDIVYNNHEKKGESNEKSRSDYPSVDNPATRRHKPREAD